MFSPRNVIYLVVFVIFICGTFNNVDTLSQERTTPNQEEFSPVTKNPQGNSIGGKHESQRKESEFGNGYVFPMNMYFFELNSEQYSLDVVVKTFTEKEHFQFISESDSHKCPQQCDFMFEDLCIVSGLASSYSRRICLQSQTISVECMSDVYTKGESSLCEQIVSKGYYITSSNLIKTVSPNQIPKDIKVLPLNLHSITSSKLIEYAKVVNEAVSTQIMFEDEAAASKRIFTRHDIEIPNIPTLFSRPAVFTKVDKKGTVSSFIGWLENFKDTLFAEKLSTKMTPTGVLFESKILIFFFILVLFRLFFTYIIGTTVSVENRRNAVVIGNCIIIVISICVLWMISSSTGEILFHSIIIFILLFTGEETISHHFLMLLPSLCSVISLIVGNVTFALLSFTIYLSLVIGMFFAVSFNSGAQKLVGYATLAFMCMNSGSFVRITSQSYSDFSVIPFVFGRCLKIVVENFKPGPLITTVIVIVFKIQDLIFVAAGLEVHTFVLVVGLVFFSLLLYITIIVGFMKAQTAHSVRNPNFTRSDPVTKFIMIMAGGFQLLLVNFCTLYGGNGTYKKPRFGKSDNAFTKWIMKMSSVIVSIVLILVGAVFGFEVMFLQFFSMCLLMIMKKGTHLTPDFESMSFSDKRFGGIPLTVMHRILNLTQSVKVPLMNGKILLGKGLAVTGGTISVAHMKFQQNSKIIVDGISQKITKIAQKVVVRTENEETIQDDSVVMVFHGDSKGIKSIPFVTEAEIPKIETIIMGTSDSRLPGFKVVNQDDFGINVETGIITSKLQTEPGESGAPIFGLIENKFSTSRIAPRVIGFHSQAHPGKTGFSLGILSTRESMAEKYPKLYRQCMDTSETDSLSLQSEKLEKETQQKAIQLNNAKKKLNDLQAKKEDITRKQKLTDEKITEKESGDPVLDELTQKGLIQKSDEPVIQHTVNVEQRIQVLSDLFTKQMENMSKAIEKLNQNQKKSNKKNNKRFREQQFPGQVERGYYAGRGTFYTPSFKGNRGRGRPQAQPINQIGDVEVQQQMQMPPQ